CSAALLHLLRAPCLSTAFVVAPLATARKAHKRAKAKEEEEAWSMRPNGQMESCESGLPRNASPQRPSRCARSQPRRSLAEKASWEGDALFPHAFLAFSGAAFPPGTTASRQRRAHTIAPPASCSRDGTLWQPCKEHALTNTREGSEVIIDFP
ncbi:unnamed protein product, partial [Phaeothamnion confervicola]